MPEPFWSAPIETVLAELAARPDGLSQIEADRRLLRLGPNRRSDTGAITPLGLLLNQFRSPLVILLLFAMTLSLFLGETTEHLASAGKAVITEATSGYPRVQVLDAEPSPVVQIGEADLPRIARAFGELADLKNPFTHGHAANVTELSLATADRLGLDRPPRLNEWLT
jgi:hypothetical protein